MNHPEGKGNSNCDSLISTPHSSIANSNVMRGLRALAASWHVQQHSVEVRSGSKEP